MIVTNNISWTWSKNYSKEIFNFIKLLLKRFYDNDYILMATSVFFTSVDDDALDDIVTASEYYSDVKFCYEMQYQTGTEYVQLIYNIADGERKLVLESRDDPNNE